MTRIVAVAAPDEMDSAPVLVPRSATMLIAGAAGLVNRLVMATCTLFCPSIESLAAVITDATRALLAPAAARPRRRMPASAPVTRLCP